MSKIVVVTSGKGGVGKTTVSAFLGAKLARRGKRTVVCDLDFGLNNLDIVMGCEKQVVYDLSDAITGRCRATQALVECKTVKNLFMISSEHSASGGVVNANNLKQLLEGLKSCFDFVILDCPAGIDSGFHRAIASSHEALIVITPNLSSLRDADKVLSVIRTYKIQKYGLVVNMVRGDLLIEGEILTPKEIEDLLKTKVVGVIPQDDAIIKSTNCYISEAFPSGEALKKLSDYLITGKVKLYNPASAYKGFWGSIKRSLKKRI